MPLVFTVLGEHPPRGEEGKNLLARSLDPRRTNQQIDATPVMLEGSQRCACMASTSASERRVRSSLYIFQREFFILPGILSADGQPSFDFELITSDRATTCHILVIHAVTTKEGGIGQLLACACAHVDTKNRAQLGRIVGAMVEGVDTTARTLVPTSVGTEHYSLVVDIVGGFVEESAGAEPSLSYKITTRLLETLHARPEPMILRHSAIWTANTNISAEGIATPIITGCCFDIKDCSLKAAYTRTLDAEPGVQWRSLRHFDTRAGGYKLIFDSSLQSLRVPAVMYDEIDSAALEWLLRLDDASLLERTSTSPLVEGPDFVETVRKNFTYLKRFPVSSDSSPKQFDRCRDCYGWHVPDLRELSIGPSTTAL